MFSACTAGGAPSLTTLPLDIEKSSRIMNNKMATAPSAALQFMHRCRQSSRIFKSPNSPIRHASQATPSTYTTPPNPSRRPKTARLDPARPSPTPVARALPRGVYSEGRAPTEVRGPSVWTAIRSVLGFKPKPSGAEADESMAPFTSINNPYRARKSWPPNFKTLHPKHQFHYEKTYRRRMKLKYARPRWTKATKLVQWTLIYGVLFYWVFFLQMGEDGTPFENVSTSDCGIVVRCIRAVQRS